MATRIVVDGVEYASVEAMPDGVRQAYQAALARFADADGNGVPDVAERARGDDVVVIRQSTFRLDFRGGEGAGEGPGLAGALLGSPMRRRRDHDPALAALAGAGHALEGFLAVLLALVAIAILAGGVLIIARMDAGSAGQGGRFYVAAAVVLALGAVVGSATRLAERRWGTSGLFGGTSPASRRFAAASLLGLLLAATLVFGLALRLS